MPPVNYMEVVRPSWYPDRLDWYPGEPYRNLAIRIREAGGQDFRSIQGVCRVAGFKANTRTILKWLGQNCFTAYVAVRNSRHVVALCVARHTPDRSTIVVNYVYPSYRSSALEMRMLLLAACELPETPLYWSFSPSEDESRAGALTRVGWEFDGRQIDEDGQESHTYKLAPFVGRGPAKDREGTRPPFGPAAGRDGPGRDAGGHDPADESGR